MTLAMLIQKNKKNLYNRFTPTTHRFQNQPSKFIRMCVYLRSNGLSFSVKKVMAFPLCPALPVRPGGMKKTDVQLREGRQTCARGHITDLFSGAFSRFKNSLKPLTRLTDSVDVLNGTGGEVVVKYKIDSFEVDTSGKQSCADQNPNLP